MGHVLGATEQLGLETEMVRSFFIKSMCKLFVYISLSEKGRNAFHHHAEFHREMIEGIKETLDEDEMQVLVRALSKFDGWFREKEKQNS